MKQSNLVILRELASALRKNVTIDDSLRDSIMAYENAARRISNTFSGSWLGYHSRVYYADFELPPSGARFNPEWGLMLNRGIVAAVNGLSGSIGDWQEFTEDQILARIIHIANRPKVDLEKKYIAEKEFEKAQSKADSILVLQKNFYWDAYLEKRYIKATELKLVEATEIIKKENQIAVPPQCRDIRAVSEGTQIPQHVLMGAKMSSIRQTFKACETLANILDEIATHLESIGGTLEQKNSQMIFIGHGRSSAWRDLKDFLQEKLHLQVQEFNSASAAGLTVTERLSDMMNSSTFAFLVMTGEDSDIEGRLQARLNVIHEIGLFQGRLGFKKAIILLEDGCEEFSNISGLTQIRFPKHDIRSKSEEIRDVLTRENII